MKKLWVLLGLLLLCSPVFALEVDDLSNIPTVYSSAVSSLVTVSSSTGRIVSISVYNSSNPTGYLQVFDAPLTDVVTIGSTTPAYTIGVASGQTVTFAPPGGIRHSNRIQMGSTDTRTGSRPVTLDVTLSYL